VGTKRFVLRLASNRGHNFRGHRKQKQIRALTIKKFGRMTAWFWARLKKNASKAPSPQQKIETHLCTTVTARLLWKGPSPFGTYLFDLPHASRPPQEGWLRAASSTHAQ
jgi:hypothetical protein